ncbi:PREDICTED: uncharacterized protein LOC105364249 [Ceratosolen solmsi marchali]|uniref:Uncharacterized protein LOC105364249 n=1 Tax=Ceratosolen solmsi marchali TaxID=326594 RepID=A0AAJ6YLU5_9HYME|nr:PREDICTED: uncharacterized protein LOC105364249 [Ceratosolen solmsi marchali]
MMQTAQLILYWGDLNMLITILSTADLPIANSMMMLVLFSYKRKGLQDITLMAKNDWIKLKTNKELEIMNESAKTAKSLSKFCVRLSYLVSYIPYEHEKSPNYEITLIFQCLSSFIATAAFIGIESFFIIIVMHSIDVGHATYQCSWYQMETSEIKSLMLILYRSQKPFQISAGKFFIFSLNTFTSLMKTSASYLSVLIAIKDK